MHVAGFVSAAIAIYKLSDKNTYVGLGEQSGTRTRKPYSWQAFVISFHCARPISGLKANRCRTIWSVVPAIEGPPDPVVVQYALPGKTRQKAVETWLLVIAEGQKEPGVRSRSSKEEE